MASESWVFLFQFMKSHVLITLYYSKFQTICMSCLLWLNYIFLHLFDVPIMNIQNLTINVMLTYCVAIVFFLLDLNPEFHLWIPLNLKDGKLKRTTTMSLNWWEKLPTIIKLGFHDNPHICGVLFLLITSTYT